MNVVKQFYIRPWKKSKKWRHLRWWVVVLKNYRDVRRMFGKNARDCAAYCRSRKDGKIDPDLFQIFLEAKLYELVKKPENI